MFIILFLLLGAFFIISQNNLSVITNNGAVKFISAYGKWLLGFGINSIQTIGYAIKLDWFPVNSTQG